jgi:hypothetical protein
VLPVRCRLRPSPAGRHRRRDLHGEKIAAVTAFLLDDSNAAETFAPFGVAAELP